jgi:dTDP-L-rhamnose 4-epimerase
VGGVILVTGGTGFIGSHIVQQLLDDGHRVRVLDAREGHASAWLDDVELVIGDVRDRELLDRCLQGVRHVCHQAAMVGLGVDMSDLTAFASHNDLGTATLLRALAERRFDGRLVLASSMVVYGEGGYACAIHGRVRPASRDADDLRAGVFDPRCSRCAERLSPVKVDEAAPLEPASVYAATKVHQEHLCQAFARATGVPVTALRYHNVYGPRMPRDTPYAGVAAIFASALARRQAPRVFEDGKQLRDFVHVRDVARANALALTSSEPVSGPFNIASGTARTVLEMADAVADELSEADGPRPVVTGEWRAGDVRHVIASPKRAQELLGFDAMEDFARGMAELAHELATLTPARAGTA